MNVLDLEDIIHGVLERCISELLGCFRHLYGLNVPTGRHLLQEVVAVLFEAIKRLNVRPENE